MKKNMENRPRWGLHVGAGDPMMLMPMSDDEFRQIWARVLESGIATELMRRGAIMTVLSTLLSALAWPAALLAATDIIGSTCSIAVDRFLGQKKQHELN
ncbi:hypothetical protein REPUB_Repub16aG0111100 [Reevesia pubescens]